jgi:hypothetical protein
MNEGVTIYIGPHRIYEYVCQHRFPFELIPTFQDMEQSDSSVQAADLFTYALVDFIVNEYGLEALNHLIRSPDSLEDILGVNRSEFEKQWQQYMNQHYTNR